MKIALKRRAYFRLLWAFWIKKISSRNGVFSLRKILTCGEPEAVHRSVQEMERQEESVTYHLPGSFPLMSHLSCLALVVQMWWRFVRDIDRNLYFFVMNHTDSQAHSFMRRHTRLIRYLVLIKNIFFSFVNDNGSTWQRLPASGIKDIWLLSVLDIMRDLKGSWTESLVTSREIASPRLRPLPVWSWFCVD